MVQGPAGSSLVLVRNADFLGNQEPSPRRSRIDLVPRQQVGMAGEELLEIDLGAIFPAIGGGLHHLRELPGGVEQEDSSKHWIGFQSLLSDHPRPKREAPGSGL